MGKWRAKSLWSVSCRFIGAGLAFALNLVLARALSQDDVGKFFLSASVGWGGGLLSHWGASILAVKWVATARAEGDQEAIRRAAWSLILFTMAQGLVVAGILLLVPGQPRSLLMIWAAWAFSVGLQNLAPEILRGYDDVKWASLLLGPVIQFLNVGLIGGAWFAQGALSFEAAAWLAIIANFACAMFGVAMIATRAKPTKKLASYRLFLMESTPISFSLVATYVLLQADLWVCGSLFSKEMVAVYGLAQRFVAFVSMPMLIFGFVVTPTIAELFHKKEWERLKHIIRRGTMITALFATAIYAGGVILGWPIMRYLFGENYTASYPLFLILGIGHLAHAIAGPNWHMLLLSGAQSAAMFATITAAIVMTGLSWLFGRWWGVEGIALGSTVALFIQVVWMYIGVKKNFARAIRSTENGNLPASDDASKVG